MTASHPNKDDSHAARRQRWACDRCGESHYPKKLIFISRQDCVAGVHTWLPRMTIGPRARVDRASCVGPLTALRA
jgi:hypothetical protein